MVYKRNQRAVTLYEFLHKLCNQSTDAVDEKGRFIIRNNLSFERAIFTCFCEKLD